RHRPDRIDGHHGGGGGVGYGDHLIAGTDAEGTERQHNRVGAVVDPDGVGGPVVGGELALESGHALAQDQAPRREDGLYRVEYVGALRGVLVKVIPDPDSHAAPPIGWRWCCWLTRAATVRRTASRHPTRADQPVAAVKAAGSSWTLRRSSGLA